MTPTARQQRFVDEYLLDLNATQAAIRAGYSAKGASVRGAELLANRNVHEVIDAAQTARAAKLEITAAGITQKLVAIAGDAMRTGGAPGLSVARQAWMDVAKLNGLIVEAQESITRSPEERAARLAELRAERERIAGAKGMHEGCRVDRSRPQFPHSLARDPKNPSVAARWR